jgi:hypothetical protein
MTGEGFAFFRWHMLRWPEPHECEYSRFAICGNIWRGPYGRR